MARVPLNCFYHNCATLSTMKFDPIVPIITLEKDQNISNISKIARYTYICCFYHNKKIKKHFQDIHVLPLTLIMITFYSTKSVKMDVNKTFVSNFLHVWGGGAGSVLITKCIPYELVDKNCIRFNF